MKSVIGLFLTATLFAVGLPSFARAHDDGYRVCRDEDGDRVPCHQRVCRDEDGDRIPCGRVWRYSRPEYSSYRYRAPYYGYYGRPPVVIDVGPLRIYGRGW